MSSDAITPYDEERLSLGILVESLAELESGSDTASENAFEQLLELLQSVDSSLDGDDADIISDFAHPSMSDQGIVDWQQRCISTEAGTSLANLVIHTARAPVHLQAEDGTLPVPRTAYPLGES